VSASSVCVSASAKFRNAEASMCLYQLNTLQGQ